MKDLEFYKKMPRLILEAMASQGNPYHTNVKNDELMAESYFEDLEKKDWRAEQFKLCWVLIFPFLLWGLVNILIYQVDSLFLSIFSFFSIVLFFIFRAKHIGKIFGFLGFAGVFANGIGDTLVKRLVISAQAETPPTWLLFVADNSLTVIFAGISFGIASLAISRFFGLTLLLATPLLLGGLASLEFCVAMVLGEAIFFGLMLMTRRRWEAFARERFYRGLLMLGSAVLVLGLGFPWVKALSFDVFGDEFIPALRRWQFVFALAVFWLVDLGVASVFMHYRSAWQRNSKSESKN